MYFTHYRDSLAVFELALRFFAAPHIAGNTKKLHIDYEGNMVCFRSFGNPIPFAEMRELSGKGMYHGIGESKQSGDDDLSETPGCEHVISLILMGICKEMELTSFHAGKSLTSRSADDARCGTESPTCEPDGIEMRLTHEKEFAPVQVNGKILEFRALHPVMEIRVNGQTICRPHKNPQGEIRRKK